MKKQIATIMILGSMPVVSAQNATPRETDTSGVPSQEVYETDPVVERPDPNQATGAREKAQAGPPSKRTFSTKPETVESTSTLNQIVENSDRLTTFQEAVNAAGLSEALAGTDPLTVFAPSDEAFENLPDGALANLMKAENRPMLRTVLLNHMMTGIVSSEMVSAGELKMNSGQTVLVTGKEDKVKIGDATVVQPDLYASNGVIHIVDSVLMPEAE